MISLEKEKTTFWDRNGLFIKLLVFFISFWIIAYNILPIAHADGGTTDYGFINVRDTWQTITVKHDYLMGLYTKEDVLITTNFLIANPDYGVTINVYGDSNLRIQANGKTLSLPSGEVKLNATLANSFGGSDTPIYISSTSTTSVTYQICSYGSLTVVEEEDKDKAWHEKFSDWFNGLGDSLGGIGNVFNGAIDVLKDFIASFFRPIISFFEAIQEMFSQFGSISDLWDKFKDFTITPILEFFENLENGALGAFSQFWDFPVIRELVIATVAVLLIGGVFMLFVTL